MFLRATPVPRATECSDEGYAYLVGQAPGQAAEQCAAAGEIDAVAHDVAVEFGRGLLQGRLDGVFHLLYGGVDAVGYLVV